VLVPGALRATRSLRRAVASCTFELRMDSAFEAVIAGCAAAPRPGQDGTWITPDMLEAYVALHALGFAHSVEAWRGSELVGGVYGVSLGGAFFGESMFTRADGASKLALTGLVSQLDAWDFDLLDCQVRTEHVIRLGAQDWPRERFLTTLATSVRRPTRRGPWHFDRDPLSRWRTSGDVPR
jgi:leucyl/phenylalanyl-tRNA--protein transferase